MNNRTDIFNEDDEPIFVGKAEITKTITLRGSRSSLGVPMEPDESLNAVKVDTISIFGVDITELFDTSGMSEEEMTQSVFERGEELMIELFNLKKEGK